ncbi:MAG: hypothetical protein A3F35_02750 [Candidatus Woykebacteria bacterium RIFCSPHIGHO2_12_FULL_45_10]|uniref:Type II secretion system protein GspG C-terminal domain-containing protein n=1 Tax=Candidatus Woykebacteria bacterium RIFCSPHIGHO2_12_FULL_45_10 TaxID=1802603 RepID=A0A1G1WPE3_9BACT|nr:MAG: hypothetical protein A3F35_02750 [Candidatus Woykebacteria bacterium RIFCSPHIGHO2_12_FULL_45_10]
MTKFPQKQAGFGLIGLLVFAAVVFALVNLYSYFNPNFSLAKYSPVNYFKQKRDETRKADLKRLQGALESYYEEHGNHYPAGVGFCGRISNVLNSEVVTALTPYFPPNKFPEDPGYKGTGKDYFYAKLDHESYALMAVLELPPRISPDQQELYNFKGCHDWPGDDVFNYRLDTSDH